jgi:hypothetical protein
VRNEQLMQAYQVAVQREAKGARMRHSPLAGSLMQCAPQAAPLPFSKPAQACCRCFVQRPKLAASSVRHACGAAHIALADIGSSVAASASDLLARMAKQTIDANAGTAEVWLTWSPKSLRARCFEARRASCRCGGVRCVDRLAAGVLAVTLMCRLRLVRSHVAGHAHRANTPRRECRGLRSRLTPAIMPRIQPRFRHAA